MRTNRPLKSQSGLSLVELLTTIAIVGIIAVGTLRVFAIAEGASKQAEARVQLTGIADQIRSGLASRNTCTRNLRGLALNPSEVNPVPVASLSYFDSRGRATKAIVSPNPQNLEGYRVQLVPKVQVSASEVLGDIEIQSLNAQGQITSRRKVPVIARMSGSSIESCITGVDGEIDVREKTCIMTGDEYSFWNPDSQECESRRRYEYKTFYGTPTAAECAEDMQPEGWCWAEAPRGWRDPGRTISRVYPDGSVEIAGADPYRCWISRRKCTCVYAVDIETSGFKSAIPCYKEVTE